MRFFLELCSKDYRIQSHTLRLSLLLLFFVSFLSLGRAYVLPVDRNIGRSLNDGAVHNLPPNITANDPFMVQATTQIGAHLTNGSTLIAGGSGQISISENSIGDAVGLIAWDASEARFDVGSRIVISESSIGDTIGMIAENESVIDFRGALAATEDGNGEMIAAQALGSAEIYFRGTGNVTEQGNGSVVGFSASDSSYVNFSGSLVLNEQGNFDARLFHLMGDAVLDFHGTLTANSNNSDGPGALLEDNSRANLAGGSLVVQMGGGPAPGALIELTDQATSTISGGVFQVFHNSVPVLPRIIVGGQSQLVIKGSDFNYPNGLVTDASGVLIGKLWDGQQFTVSFGRALGATIRIIPEPTARKYLLMVAPACLLVRVRKK